MNTLKRFVSLDWRENFRILHEDCFENSNIFSFYVQEFHDNILVNMFCITKKYYGGQVDFLASRAT